MSPDSLWMTLVTVVHTVKASIGMGMGSRRAKTIKTTEKKIIPQGGTWTLKALTNFQFLVSGKA